MQYTFNQLKRLTGQVAIPVGFTALAVLFVWKWPFISGSFGSPDKYRAIINLLPLFPYLVFPIGALMGWRYNNTGLIFASVMLMLCHAGTTHMASSRGLTIIALLTFLLPLNIAFFSVYSKKHLFSASGVLGLGGILLQAVLVVFIFSGNMHPAIQKTFHPLFELFHTSFSVSQRLSLTSSIDNFLNSHAFFQFKTLTTPAFFAFCIAMLFLTARFYWTRDLIIPGYAGALATTMLGLTASRINPDTHIYFMTSGVILIFANIEASFFRAYVDDLTGLPGRRSLNETMANLGRKYTIAMMDIDHFKKFNDTYGHKTGDDVLRMVAVQLSRINGGAKTFRYGGEEFTAVFRGKSIEEATPHLERFREIIENTPFVVRSKIRKKKGKADRGRNNGKQHVQVTVSIGAAMPGRRQTTPDKVIKAADKALYRAKKAGRNCLCT